MNKTLLKKSLLLLGGILAQNAMAAQAPICDTYSSANRTETRAYAGLSWELNGSNGFIPDLVLGVRSLNVTSSNVVNGADFNLRMRYKNQVSLDSVRLSYVGGSRQFMGNAGIGYSLSNQNMFATVAGQSAFSRLGVDYQFGKESFNPYLEGNSLYSPKEVPQTVTAGNCYS